MYKSGSLGLRATPLLLLYRSYLLQGHRLLVRGRGVEGLRKIHLNKGKNSLLIGNIRYIIYLLAPVIRVLF